MLETSSFLIQLIVLVGNPLARRIRLVIDYEGPKSWKTGKIGPSKPKRPNAWAYLVAFKHVAPVMGQGT